MFAGARTPERLIAVINEEHGNVLSALAVKDTQARYNAACGLFSAGWLTKREFERVTRRFVRAVTRSCRRHPKYKKGK